MSRFVSLLHDYRQWCLSLLDVKFFIYYEQKTLTNAKLPQFSSSNGAVEMENNGKWVERMAMGMNGGGNGALKIVILT